MSPVGTVRELCLEILESGSLEAKLTGVRDDSGFFLPDTSPGDSLFIDAPARDSVLRMRGGADRLPGLGELGDQLARLTCLERFAHHELMAVELFAWALLAWPDAPPALRKGWLGALEDEQRHLRLYLGLMEDRGTGLGDSALSDYFWKHVQGIRESPDGPLAFLSAVGLTLEQANLDFTLLYGDAFSRAGDSEGADVLSLIHREEQGHVRLAVDWLRRLSNPGESDVDAYRRSVPFPLCAARAKAKRFDEASRRKAGLSQEMIDYVKRARPRGSLPRVQPTVGATLLPNLGAEEEKGESRRSRQRNKGNAARSMASLWWTLFGEDALLVDGRARWPDALGSRPREPVFPWLENEGRAVAWLPTDKAREACLSLDLEWTGPAPDVVGRVHEKGFAQGVLRSEDLESECLRGLIHVLEPEDLTAPGAEEAVFALAATLPEWTRGRYVLKPRLATSGRGRTRGGEDIERWKVTAAFPRLSLRGGAILEPWLERIEDYSVQLHVGADGDVELLGTTRQLLRKSGVVLGNRGVFTPEGPRSGTSHDEEMVRVVSAVARAAAAEGFSGPCGSDAFSFAGPSGKTTLRPLVELNARFTTGTVALGLLRRARAAGLTEGSRAWLFAWHPPEGLVDAHDDVVGIRLSEDVRPPTLVLGATEESLDAIASLVTGAS